MEGHPGKAFRHLPQLSGDLLVKGGRTRAGAGFRVATRLEEPAGSDMRAAFEGRISGGVENGQRSHLRALGEKATATDLPEQAVEPRRRGGGLDVRGGVAGVGGETADRRAGGAQSAVEFEGEE